MSQNGRCANPRCTSVRCGSNVNNRNCPARIGGEVARRQLPCVVGRGINNASLCQAEKTISNKDSIIKMLQDQLKKIEELYKRNLSETEQVRLKYCQASEELNKLRCICKVNDERKAQASNQNSLDKQVAALREEFVKWRTQFDETIKKQLLAQNQVPKSFETPEIDKKLKSLETLLTGHYVQLNEVIQHLIDDRNAEDTTADYVCTETTCVGTCTEAIPTASVGVSASNHEDVENFRAEIACLEQEIRDLRARNKALEDQMDQATTVTVSAFDEVRDSVINTLHKEYSGLKDKFEKLEEALPPEELVRLLDEESSDGPEEDPDLLGRRVSFFARPEKAASDEGVGVAFALPLEEAEEQSEEKPFESDSFSFDNGRQPTTENDNGRIAGELEELKRQIKELEVCKARCFGQMEEFKGQICSANAPDKKRNEAVAKEIEDIKRKLDVLLGYFKEHVDNIPADSDWEMVNLKTGGKRDDGESDDEDATQKSSAGDLDDIRSERSLTDERNKAGGDENNGSKSSFKKEPFSLSLSAVTSKTSKGTLASSLRNKTSYTDSPATPRSEDQQQAPCFKMLMDHYSDLQKERTFKDKQIKSLEEVLDCYNRATSPRAASDIDDVAEEMRQWQRYFEKIMEANTKLKTTIKDLLDSLKCKMEELSKERAKSSRDDRNSFGSSTPRKIMECAPSRVLPAVPCNSFVTSLVPGDQDLVSQSSFVASLNPPPKITTHAMRAVSPADVSNSLAKSMRTEKTPPSNLDNYIHYLQKQLQATKEIEQEVEELRREINRQQAAFSDFKDSPR